MSRRKKISIIFLVLFSVFMITSSIVLYIRSILTDEDPLEVGTIEIDTEFVSENTALYQDTMAIEDWNLNDYPYRVYILNPSALSTYGLEDFAIDSLEPFLDLYMDMYDPGGEIFQGEILTDTFIRNGSIPQFMICIHQETGDELLIKCSYYIQAQLYEFSSSLSD